MRVHITLVGGQASPIYNGIVAANPEKVVYIYSEQTKEIANRIADQVGIPSERRSMSPTDLVDIENKVKKCVERYANDEVTVNVSSGTKPWSIYFAQHFGNLPNAKVFYIDQNNILSNLTDKTSYKFAFDVDAQFKVLNNPLTKYKSIKQYTEADDQCVSQIEKLRSFNYHAFNELATKFGKNYAPSITLADGSSLAWDKQSNTMSCAIFKKNGNCLSLDMTSPNIRSLFANTGWFEYKVAKILAGWSQAIDVRLNCVFPASNNAPKNEIDIIVATDTKALFVECKTQITEITAVDKFRNAIEVYGGMGSKGIFITDAEMTPVALEKCKDSQLLAFSLQENHNGKPVDSALFEYLDKNINKINPR